MSIQYLQPILPLPISASNSLSTQVSPLLPPSSPDDLVPSQGASKKCHCKRSKCLKLYCECFAANVLCDGCKCNDCENTQQFTGSRQAAVQYKLARNSAAFEPKFKPNVPDLGVSEFTHIRGCNCKRSNCRKKYCECFQAGIECGDTCKCVKCANDGSLPHLRNFGVHNWMLPTFRAAVGSVIGVESVMMILPAANPEPELELEESKPVPKKRRAKHKRTKSYDSANSLESLTWDGLTMQNPVKSEDMWNPVKIEEEPPSQRRRLSVEEMDLCEQLCDDFCDDSTPRTQDAMIAGLLVSPECDQDITSLGRDDSSESLMNVSDDVSENESYILRLGADLMCPGTDLLDGDDLSSEFMSSELMDMMNDTRGSIWGPNAASC